MTVLPLLSLILGALLALAAPAAAQTGETAAVITEIKPAARPRGGEGGRGRRLAAGAAAARAARGRRRAHHRERERGGAALGRARDRAGRGRRGDAHGARGGRGRAGPEGQGPGRGEPGLPRGHHQGVVAGRARHPQHGPAARDPEPAQRAACCRRRSPSSGSAAASPATRCGWSGRAARSSSGARSPARAGSIPPTRPRSLRTRATRCRSPPGARPPQEAWFEVVDAARARAVADDLTALEQELGTGVPPTSKAVMRAGLLAREGLLHDARRVVVAALDARPRRADAPPAAGRSLHPHRPHRPRRRILRRGPVPAEEIDSPHPALSPEGRGK